ISQELPVIILGLRRGPGHCELVGRKIGYQREHAFQHTPNFLLATAWKQCNNRTLIQLMLLPKMVGSLKAFHYVEQRMAYIVHLVGVSGIEVGFKRQDHIEPFNRFPDLLDTTRMPGPQLWGNVVKYPNALGSGPSGDAQVEPRVIHQDEHIGLITKNIALAK